MTAKTKTTTITTTSTVEELNEDRGSVFERKPETITAGLPREYFNLLRNKISKEDAFTVTDYLISLKTEIGPPDNFNRSIIRILTSLCRGSPSETIRQRNIFVI